jgi:hypothetical protein
MGAVTTAVLSQILLPVLATNVVSKVKQRAALREVDLLADAIEERIRSAIRSARKGSPARNSGVFLTRDPEMLRQMREGERDASANTVVRSAVSAARATAEFLIRYPEAKEGKYPFKDLVCDLSSAAADVLPLMGSLGFADGGTPEMASYIMNEVTEMVTGDKCEEAADLIYGGIKSLVVSEKGEGDVV